MAHLVMPASQQFWMNSVHIRHKWPQAWEDVSHTMTFDLDLYLQVFFGCDVAYFVDNIHMWHKYHPWGDDVLCTISRSICQRSK